MEEHPLGNVLGHTKYGDYLFIYQGITVGGNRKYDKLYYTVIGNNVVMYTVWLFIWKNVIYALLLVIQLFMNFVYVIFLQLSIPLLVTR